MARRLIIVLERESRRAGDWLRQAASRGVDVQVERNVADVLRHLGAALRVTLVVGCGGYSHDQVLDLVREARSREEPVAALLLTDDGEGYRRALGERGLTAEILASTATVAELMTRLGFGVGRAPVGR